MVRVPGVDYLLLVINSSFPLSQPRVLAPQAKPDGTWPHVEQGGLLCLTSTNTSLDPGQRVLYHLQSALELFNYSDDQCRLEFEREFSAYWEHSLTNKQKPPAVLSLLKPSSTSREIYWSYDHAHQQIIAAENKDDLLTWLRNSKNHNFPQYIGWLEWLPKPLVPVQFPKVGSDVIKFLPKEIIPKIIQPGQDCLVIFGTTTITGPVFVATKLRGSEKKHLAKGFRNIARVPQQFVTNSFGACPAQRCVVTRADGSWVHGRDKDTQFRWLSKRKAAVLGCGALGGSIARLLAQAGVCDFLLVDYDTLAPQNTSRHVLGHPSIFMNKAIATADMLKTDFPHIKNAEAMQQRFSDLNDEQRTRLSECDILISAGIDYEGDMQIDAWRQLLPCPPVHVCTWLEEFAIIGHAVALFGVDRLSIAFDANERVRFRVTDWPNTKTLLIEAGCGNVFQPHGAIELQSTVNIAAGLALDVLCGKVTMSLRRVWYGDREEMIRRGGTALSLFEDSRCVREYPWQ